MYAGISRWPEEATRYACEYMRKRDVPVLVYQGRLNLLDRSMERDGLLRAVRELRTGLVAFSPLAQGLLAGRYLEGIPSDSRMRTDVTLPESTLTPELLARLRRWDALARARGESLARVALRWVLQRPEVTSVIVGVSRLEQLADNLAVLSGQPLSEEELRLLDE